MSGFTDAFYREWTAFFSRSEHQLDGPAARALYATREAPDVWFKPLRVWEIKGADLSLSPVHLAGAGLAHPERGISLRFPRFVRERTDEKAPDGASTGEDVAALYHAQSARRAGKGGAAAGGFGGAHEDDDDE
jgi:DNA ligase 1